MLSDEDKFLHTVAVFRIPVTHQPRFLPFQFRQVLFGGGSVPQSGFRKLLLHACLFKQVRHVAIVAEVADAFGTDDVARPSGGDEVVELVDVESRTAIVDKRTDAIFFHFAVFHMMVVMVFMVMMNVFFRMMMLVVMMSFPLLLFGGRAFYAPDPSGGSGGTFKVEETGMDNLLQVYIGIVTFYDFGAGLQGADDVLDAFQFFRLYLPCGEWNRGSGQWVRARRCRWLR